MQHIYQRICLLCGMVLLSHSVANAFHPAPKETITAGTAAATAATAAASVVPAAAGEGWDREDKASFVASINRLGYFLERPAPTTSPLASRAVAKPKNEVMSSVSVHQALTMAYLGTGPGKNQEEMAETLGINDSLPLDTIAMNSGTLKATLELKATTTENAPPQLKVANQVVISKRFEVKADYLDRVAKMGATPQVLDFANEKVARGTINDSVSKATGGRIPEILSKIEVDEVMFLINAVYFKGEWADKFIKSSTELKPFFLLGKGKKTVQMMHDSHENRNSRYYYQAPTGEQILELAYANDIIVRSGRPRFAMYVYLPAEGVDFERVRYEVSPGRLNDLISKMRSETGNVSIPKFRVEADYELKDALKRVGMKSAFVFSPSNFPGINERESLAISRVVHKTFVSIDEYGTEAAAATAVPLASETVVVFPKESQFTFNANRPFLFFIRDNLTGTILFKGSVVDP